MHLDKEQTSQAQSEKAAERQTCASEMKVTQQ